MTFFNRIRSKSFSKVWHLKESQYRGRFQFLKKRLISYYPNNPFFRLMSIKVSFGERKNRNPFSSLAGGLICTVLAVLGFYAAFFAREISGGVPFIPADLNQAFARFLFGAGALFLSLLAVYAFREAYILLRDRRKL
jgi:hypothetical protein